MNEDEGGTFFLRRPCSRSAPRSGCKNGIDDLLRFRRRASSISGGTVGDDKNDKADGGRRPRYGSTSVQRFCENLSGRLVVRIFDRWAISLERQTPFRRSPSCRPCKGRFVAMASIAPVRRRNKPGARFAFKDRERIVCRCRCIRFDPCLVSCPLQGEPSMSGKRHREKAVSSTSDDRGEHRAL